MIEQKLEFFQAFSKTKGLQNKVRNMYYAVFSKDHMFHFTR